MPMLSLEPALSFTSVPTYGGPFGSERTVRDVGAPFQLLVRLRQTLKDTCRKTLERGVSQ